MIERGTDKIGPFSGPGPIFLTKIDVTQKQASDGPFVFQAKLIQGAKAAGAKH
jgi:hypothetical protein